jgi:hypothetical protein
MTVIVNPHTEEQEKALVEFLDRMQYDYQSDTDDIGLTELHRQEILKRDNDFINGKTTARDWNDIKRELRSVYR